MSIDNNAIFIDGDNPSDDSDNIAEDAGEAPVLPIAVRRAVTALRRDLDACAKRLSAGDLSAVDAAFGAVSAGVSSLDDAVRAAGLTAQQIADNTEAAEELTVLSASVDRCLRLSQALGAAAGSLADDARRLQLKRAGGGLYSEIGGAPTSSAFHRVIGKL